MSCPCTSTSMSGSRWLTPGAFRRDPAIARSRGAYSVTGSMACRTALSWIIRSKFPLARIAATTAGNNPIWARVRCAATSRTRHPAHSDGASHSWSLRLSKRSARLPRSPSMARHTSSRFIPPTPPSACLIPAHRATAWYDYLTILIMVRESV